MSDNNFIPLNASNQFIGFGSSTNKIKSIQWLIDNGYGVNTIVYAIINKIVTTSLDIPLVVTDSNNEIVEKGKVYEALQEPAIYLGEYINTKDWVEYSMTYLLTSGNLFQRKEKLIGIDQTYLEIIPSGLVTPKMSNSYLSRPIGYTINNNYNQDSITYDDMSHTKYINPTSNGLNTGLGLSPLQAALLSLTGSSDVQEALAIIIKNQGARGIISPKNGGMPTSGTLLSRWKAEIKEKLFGTEKVGSIHVSNTSLDYLAMGMSATDLKLIESGVLTDRMLCNAYSVDSKLFNDPSASTFNNLKEATKGLYENAIIPTLTKVVESFNRSVASELDRNQKVIIDTSKIIALQPDKKEEADRNKANTKAISEVLAMNTSTNSKIETLQYVFGMPEETAIKIVGNGDNGEG